MKRPWLLLALLTTAAVAQVHTFPALDTNNTWTGINNFQGVTAGVVAPFPGVPTGACLEGQLAINSSNLNLYDCHSGVWVLVSGGGGGSGTVTSVAETFTGGIITVSGSPVTTSGTLALTIAGTSGGIPYFSGVSTWASSAALTANGVVLGGGAGVAPTVTAADSTTTHALFATAGAPAFRAVATGDLPATVVYNNQANTFTTAGTLDLSASTVSNAFKVPVGAGLLASADGSIAYDSTNKNTHVRANGLDGIVGAFTVTPLTGNCIKATVTSGAVVLSDVGTACGTGTVTGSGLTSGQVVVGNGSSAIQILAGPTAPNSVAQVLTSTPSGGVAGAPTWNLSGVATNAQVGTTYTVAVTDRQTYVSFSNAAAIAVTLPQAGSAGFANNFTMAACDIGAGTATITPTTSNISFSNGSTYTSAAASMALTTGQCAFIYSDNTNYFAILRGGGGGGASAFTTLTYNAAGTTTFALASGATANGKVTVTHATSSTLAITGPANGGSYVLEIVQDATGGGVTLTLGSGCTWKVGGGGAGAITLSTAANAIDTLAFTFDGTNCIANFRQNYN